MRFVLLFLLCLPVYAHDCGASDYASSSFDWKSPSPEPAAAEPPSEPLGYHWDNIYLDRYPNPEVILDPYSGRERTYVEEDYEEE